MSHTGTRKPLKRLAPYRVFWVVLRLAFAGDNSPHGISLVLRKNKGQQPDWHYLRRSQRRWAQS